MALSYLYLFVVLGGGVGSSSPAGPYAAVVQLKGPIKDGSPSNAVSVSKSLTRAFEDANAKGIILYVNSPGGSPVQSSIIYDRVVSLKAKYPKKRIVTVATDNVVSGAYFIASATDRIFVNRSTITGSIGVISAGFGFTDVLERVGIERRVFTAGRNKDRLDQFLPVLEDDETKMAEILASIHEHFIESVKSGRGDHLDLNTEGLFEGDFWTGSQAIDIGLVDGLGDLSGVMEQEFGVVHAKDFTVRPALIDRIMKYATSTAIDEIYTRNQLTIG